MKKNILEKIETWAKKTGLTVEELTNRFNGYLEKEKDETRALKLLRNELSEEFGSMSSSATPFYTFLIGDSGMFDWVERMKEKVERMIANNRLEEAVQKGYVTPDGQVLDWRAKRFGRDNPRKGLPLEGFEFERDLFGIVSSDPTFETVRFAEIMATGERAENLKDIELFKFYRFRGNIGSKRSDSNVVRIYPGSRTIFSKYSTDLTPKDLMGKIEYYDLEEGTIEDIYNSIFAKSPRSNRVVALKGEVSRIMFEPRENRRTGRPSRSFILVPEDMELYSKPLYCTVNLNIPIVFRELDSIIAVGRLWKSNRGYGMEVKGILPLGI